MCALQCLSDGAVHSVGGRIFLPLSRIEEVAEKERESVCVRFAASRLTAECVYRYLCVFAGVVDRVLFFFHHRRRKLLSVVFLLLLQQEGEWASEVQLHYYCVCLDSPTEVGMCV